MAAVAAVGAGSALWIWAPGFYEQTTPPSSREPVSKREAIAAARARVAADKKRGVTTDARIIALSQLKAS